MATAAAPPRATSSNSGAKKSEESVCVAVNIRPLIDIELDQGCQECLYVTPGTSQVRAACGRPLEPNCAHCSCAPALAHAAVGRWARKRVNRRLPN